MQITKNFTCLLISAILISAATVKAQTTATWIGPASGGEWNTDANWDTGLAPADSTTNAVIGAGTNVSYNLPMTVASFGGLTNNGVLNVNTNRFNCSSITMIIPSGGDKLFITNSGAAVTVSGNLTMGTNAAATLGAGTSLTVGSLLVDANTSSHASGTSTFTNNGGTLMANSTTINNNTGTGTGRLVINGGTNNLGNTGVGRYNSSSSSTLGTEGLIIYNGVVTMTNLNVGNGNAASYMTTLIAGGTVTNIGNVSINQATGGRVSRLLQTGGLFVTPDPNVINPNSTASATAIAVFSVTGGTNITGGLSFGDTAGAASTVRFTNGASIFVGSQGIVWNGTITLIASLNNGGGFGATADWTGSAPMSFNGTGAFTFQTADVDGTPHNITLTGVLSGGSSTALTKTGNGTLTLNAADTYSGSTLINTGTLALGSSGSLTSGTIMVGSGATFDVSTLGGAYALNSGQTLAGFGTVTGAVTAAASAIIYPGSNTLTGTLTLKNSLTENGGVNNQFNLSGDPNGPNNDFLNVQGDLNVSGTNIISINGSVPSGAKYGLIHYGGSFNGGVTNFTLSNATGTLSNSVASQTIYLVVANSLRAPTNLVWVGNAVTNDWDTEVTTNWLNAGALDFFVPNDNVLFSDTGVAHPQVNLIGTVTPASVVVNTTTNYVFNGTGTIGGSSSLTVSNGILTILNTNTYTGPTILAGGVLEAAGLALGGTPSSIGSATTDPANLVFSNATLRYLGDSTTTDRGATFATNSTATFDIYNSVTLTESGTLTGSGGLTKSGPGTLNLTGSGAYTGNTTLSNGVLQLNGTATVGTGALVFEGGTATLASSSSSQSYGNTLNVVTTGTLIVNGANANNIMSGGWTGSGTLDINIPNAAGYCTLNHAITTNFTGTIFLGSTAGSFRFNSGGNSSGTQQCNGSALATFDLGTNTATFFNRNGGGDSFGTYYLGALTGGSGTIMKGSASANSASTYQIGDKNLSTTFKGTIVNGTGGSSATVAIVKTGTGTLTLEGANTYTGTTTVSNGVLALANNPDTSTDGSIDSSATINVLPGAFLDISGRSDGTLQLQPSQQLRGRGTILGSLNVSGTGAPGGGPGGSTGTLTVTNTVNLYGTAWMKLNRTNSPNSDRLVSSTAGIINYGGTLVVTNIGASLHVGDTFTLFSAATLNGSFTLVLPSYYTWDTSQLTVNGSVSVTAVLPLPSIITVDFSGLAGGSITLNANNGAPNGPVSILTSTNLVLPLSSWTTVTTTTFDGSGNLSLPITVDPTLPQSFYLLQVY